MLQDTCRFVRQEIKGADGLDAPPLGGEVLDGVLDDGEQRLQLAGRPAEIVGGQEPESDDLDAGLLRPLEELGDLVGAALVAGADVGQSHGPGPAAVAVEDDADVAGVRVGTQPCLKPLFVQLVDQVPKAHMPHPLASSSPPVSNQLSRSAVDAGSVRMNSRRRTSMWLRSATPR